MEKINKEIEKLKRNKTKVPDDLNELAHNYAFNKYTPRIAEFAKIHFIEGFKAASKPQPSEQKPPNPLNVKGAEEFLIKVYGVTKDSLNATGAPENGPQHLFNKDQVISFMQEYAQQSRQQVREEAIQECIEIVKKCAGFESHHIAASRINSVAAELEKLKYRQ